MKNIKTLVQDIKGLFTDKPVEVPDDLVEQLGKDLAETFKDRLSNRQGNYLRISNLGTACDKKLWHQVNTPELGEPLKPETRINFLFGDIIEHLTLFLAKVAGHTVTDEQKTVDLHGVKGHIDAVIDGHLVDVKSTSTMGFQKFSSGLKPNDDAFGYIHQLQGYMEALDEPEASFLAVEKQFGKITLDTHTKSKVSAEKLVQRTKEMLSNATPPPRAFEDEPFQAGGNRQIPMYCRYCDHKWHCWPGLRGFAYSKGPVYLTKVVKLPDVPEIKPYKPE